MINIALKIKKKVNEISNSGSIFTETLMKIGMVVIIGGAVLTALNAAIPDLFNELVTKIKTVLQITG